MLGWNAYTESQCASAPSRLTPAARAQTDRNGFTRVCRRDVSRYDVSFGSLDRAIGKLAFKRLGGNAESITDVPARLVRGFQMPDGHRLMLSEHDMSADGVRSYRHPDDEPERISGLRARLTVMEAAPGQAVSHLSWVEGRRGYELWMDANVAREPLCKELFALTMSLPKSVPAGPNEPPKPVGGTEWERFTASVPMPGGIGLAKMTRTGKRACR